MGGRRAGAKWRAGVTKLGLSAERQMGTLVDQLIVMRERERERERERNLFAIAGS